VRGYILTCDKRIGQRAAFLLEFGQCLDVNKSDCIGGRATAHNKKASLDGWSGLGCWEANNQLQSVIYKEPLTQFVVTASF
jgi:hypothetical protein